MTSSTLQTEDPRPSFPARLRTETYLARVDWHLEAVMNGKHRRSTIRELRQAILSDPRGIDVSLDDLGSPKSLARQYGDDEDLHADEVRLDGEARGLRPVTSVDVAPQVPLPDERVGVE